MSTGPSIERVEEVLTSLLVGSGGKLSRKEIVPGWSVLFSEYRDGGDPGSAGALDRAPRHLSVRHEPGSLLLP